MNNFEKKALSKTLLLEKVQKLKCPVNTKLKRTTERFLNDINFTSLILMIGIKHKYALSPSSIYNSHQLIILKESQFGNRFQDLLPSPQVYLPALGETFLYQVVILVLLDEKYFVKVEFCALIKVSHERQTNFNLTSLLQEQHFHKVLETAGEKVKLFIILTVAHHFSSFQTVNTLYLQCRLLRKYLPETIDVLLDVDEVFGFDKRELVYWFREEFLGENLFGFEVWEQETVPIQFFIVETVSNPFVCELGDLAFNFT